MQLQLIRKKKFDWSVRQIKRILIWRYQFEHGFTGYENC